MPVMGGLEMIRAIGSLKAGTRYIVVTARNDDATIRKLQAIGLCAFVMKPLNFDDLFEAIERCIK